MAARLRVRTVRLELLRAGPPHNQLLSPLTPYLGICGDFPAGVVHVPYEHAQFERRLNDLRYSGLTETRLAQLRETGVDMGSLLAAVPGLPGSVSADSESPDDTMIHLRITLSASELALLPFELSKVPITTESESEAWLALQTKPPVCITRHIRTVAMDAVTWPSQPRILFIAGATADIPFEAHRRALEQAIAPFQYPGRDEPAEGVDARHTHYGNLLTIIENASLDDIVTAFRSASYTHVHVLAHGAVDFSSKSRPFGIRLRGRNGGSDIVSGERFSTALARVDRDRVNRPFVVTLASCDSGLVSGVIEPAPGASFAHTLHQSGIPLVIGSQFPLTKEGSVTVVEVIYGGLLRGENPHVLAHQTRSELHARYGADTHDWASLVVYEAMPVNMDVQLEHVTYFQGKRRLDAALQRVDLAVSHAIDRQEAPPDHDRLEADVYAAVEALPYDGAYAIECRGLKASALKRLAQASYLSAKTTTAGDEAIHLSRSCERLEDALATYEAAARMFLRNDTTSVQRAATLHWVLVQQLALQGILRHQIDQDAWATARHAALLYVNHPSREERGWAHASLAELALLKLTMPLERTDEAGRQLRSHIEQLVAECLSGPKFPISSTHKQFSRYVDWWGAEPFSSVAAKRVRTHPQNWHDANTVINAAKDVLTLLGDSTPAQMPAPRQRPRRLPEREEPAQPASDASALGTRRDRQPRSRPHEGAYLDIHMLPAQYGDCLWIEYGTDPRAPSRVLIDCGTPRTSGRLLAKAESLPRSDRAVELFILTHIDEDHIGGAIPFLEAEMGGLDIREVWFNGYRHLSELLGAAQGERFSTLIEQRSLRWNQWADQRAIVVGEELPRHVLPGGLALTLLSPTRDKLDALRVKWEAELRAKGMTPGAGLDPDELLGGDELAESTDVEAMARLPFKSDKAAPNGSSIAVLAEFEGKSVLLAADAHPEVLEASIGKVLQQRGLQRLPLGALKVSHHGSHGNTSPGLLQLLDCPRYLVSTNGQKFNHPHRETISRLVRLGGSSPSLFFNYFAKDKNDVWARPDLQEQYGYRAVYPESSDGLVVRL